MAGVVDLRSHCRRRLDRFQADLEEGIDADGGIRRAGLRVMTEVEMAMYEHVQGALKRWSSVDHWATDNR